jgi:hypothetical protein
MIVNIFLGPSMPVAEAIQILPEAIFLPPAQQSDLLATVNQHGATIVGIIDGTFHQNLSVWHNEVLYLLNRGVSVFGASSMGALRAAETDIFGMVGIGQIYRWYKDGVITGDDEVALLHGDEDSDYRAVSLPLVNIRASVAAAVANQKMTPETAAQLIEIARTIYYPDRRLGAILQSCREAVLTQDQLDTVQRALTEGYVDQKKADAREMLLAIRRCIDGVDALPASVPFTFANSSVFETLYNLDQRTQTNNGEVTLQAVAEYFALNNTDFQHIKRAALDRSIVSIFAYIIGIRPTQAELDAERVAFNVEHRITSPEDLALWLRQNVFSEGDLDDYLYQEANCRRLRKWMQSSSSLDRGAKAVVDQIRMRGVFPQWASAAAEQAAILDTYRSRPEYRHIADEDPRRLAAAHTARTGIRIEGDAGIWAGESGFEDANSLLEALQKSVITGDVRGRIARQLEALEMAESR